jgi:FkbM family methyltransferase
MGDEFWLITKKLWRMMRERYFPTNQQRIGAKYYADGGDLHFRYEYDLTADSLVMDLGGYRGQWSSDIFSRYLCTIYVFEPVRFYAERIQNRFAGNPKIHVLPFGLGGSSRKEMISVNEDSSSIFRDFNDKQEVEIVDCSTWLRNENITSVDLMKVNIEGGEYELLERLIETALIGIVRNLQVQFHEISQESRVRMERIQNELRNTHSLTYQYPFVWENWVLD